MVDSKEFAVGIFDALARRRRQNLERISKDELYEFWLQISDQSFDARLQIFFDMCAHNPALISSSVFLSQLVLCSLLACVLGLKQIHFNSGWTPTWTVGSRGKKCKR
jgi:hypothetical protein